MSIQTGIGVIVADDIGVWVIYLHSLVLLMPDLGNIDSFILYSWLIESKS